MNMKHKRPAWAGHTHGGCRLRTLSRSAVNLVGKVGEGIVQAVKVWFEPRAEGTV